MVHIDTRFSHPGQLPTSPPVSCRKDPNGYNLSHAT